MFKINEEALNRALNKSNNVGISGEFRKCKLLGAETGYSNSSDMPRFTLIYEVAETGEIIQDNFYFTEKSLPTVVERLNNAYKAMTGLTLNQNDFIPITNLKTKFDSICGKECGIKEYQTKGGYTGYMYYLNNNNNDNAISSNYGFWGENISNQNVAYVQPTHIPLVMDNSPFTPVTPVNLDEELGGNQ